MMAFDVTVVMPHIPTRKTEFARALHSVAMQTQQPVGIVIATDYDHVGSAATRNNALLRSYSTWTAFLDDDDEMMPEHLESLVKCAVETNSDVVYSGCKVLRNGQSIPVIDEWGRFGKAFDPELLKAGSYIPVTSLVRTSHAKAYGGFNHQYHDTYDDWCFYLSLLQHGSVFTHLPLVTWIWNHHDGNTSGKGDRW